MTAVAVRKVERGDTDLARARDDYTAITRMKDEFLIELDGMFKQLAADQFDAIEPGANRATRKRIAAGRRLLAGRQRKLVAFVERGFQQIVRGFDPETGTLTGVQEEAAALLAEALADLGAER